MVRLAGRRGITLVITWLFLLRGIQMQPRWHMQKRSSFNQGATVTKLPDTKPLKIVCCFFPQAKK